MTKPVFIPTFRHRENLDGTWDSICMHCYGMAAHTHRQSLLDAAESGHRCDETSWLFKEPIGVAPRVRKIADLPAPSRDRLPSPIPGRPFEHIQPGHMMVSMRHIAQREQRKPETRAGV
jgi:hypothetical protein